jgi:NADPH-dependent ferric siderophore reductase
MTKGIYSVFTVKDKILLTPHYVRIKFAMTDEQRDQFRTVNTGSHNKIFLSAEIKRTYTTRHIDYEQKELWIDFVAHGDNGPASRWAYRAVPGDILGIAVKEGSRPLFPEAGNYLFAGDHTALPVIGAMLEQLPAGVKVNVIVEVNEAVDELLLFSKADLNIQWLHNPKPEQGSRLAEAVCARQQPGDKRFVFVAAEYETAKILKNYFKEKLAWPPEAFSVVSHWRKGESEEQSSLTRREERMR